jgi:hypothetical protein
MECGVRSVWSRGVECIFRNTLLISQRGHTVSLGLTRNELDILYVEDQSAFWDDNTALQIPDISIVGLVTSLLFFCSRYSRIAEAPAQKAKTPPSTGHRTLEL